MGITLAGWCMDSATSLCWLAMEYRGKWRWWRGEQLRNILQRKYYPNLLLWWSLLDYTHRKRQEQKIYEEMIRTIPGIEERLVNLSEEEIKNIADQASLSEFLFTKFSFLLSFTKGVSSSRGDNTRSLKSAVFDWITPQGQALNPPLAWNKKDDCGFNHETTGALLCLIDLDWSDTE